MISFTNDPKLLWKLALNDMRDPKIEYATFVACASTKEELEALLEQEKVPTYRDDDRWGKTFRKGGPLEWFNSTAFFPYQGIYRNGPQEATKAILQRHGVYNVPDNAFEEIDDLYRAFQGN